MSDIDVIKEVFASVSDMFHGTIGKVFLYLWLLFFALMLIVRTIKLLCLPRRIEKTGKLLPDSIDSEYTELSECFRDDF